jgi:hypothetical protein
VSKVWWRRMNSQQQQLLQGLGINPAQIQAIQAQAARAQQGHSVGPTGDHSTSAQPQPINLAINRDASGGMKISGLEGLTFVQAPTGMYEDGRGGGTIKISSSFKDVHGFLSFLSSFSHCICVRAYEAT